MAEAPRKVTFARVTNPRVRAPSWLPAARPRGALRKEEPLPSLKPPPLPSEFVDAIRQELEPERAMLFCGEELMTLYASFGFRPIVAPVSAEQPGGRVVMPMSAMWAPLAEGIEWPAGDVAVRGRPF